MRIVKFNEFEINENVKMSSEYILLINDFCRAFDINNYSINQNTGRIDVDGDVELNIGSENSYNYKKFFLKNATSDGVRLPVKFGEVSGYFYSRNSKLRSLEGFPTKVGDYLDIRENKITSLKGCPNEIGDDFICYNNKLESLEYGPIKVGGSYNIKENNITSLKGCPQKINGNFICSYNKLTSLEYGPIETEDYICNSNSIVSLKHVASKINGSLDCNSNKLTSLEYLKTSFIEKDLNVAGNKIETLLGCPEKINGDFLCNVNQLTSLEYGPIDISGRYSYNGNLIDSEVLKFSISSLYNGDNGYSNLNQYYSTILHQLDLKPDVIIKLVSNFDIDKGIIIGYINSNFQKSLDVFKKMWNDPDFKKRYNFTDAELGKIDRKFIDRLGSHADMKDLGF